MSQLVTSDEIGIFKGAPIASCSFRGPVFNRVICRGDGVSSRDNDRCLARSVIRQREGRMEEAHGRLLRLNISHGVSSRRTWRLVAS